MCNRRRRKKLTVTYTYTNTRGRSGSPQKRNAVKKKTHGKHAQTTTMNSRNRSDWIGGGGGSGTVTSRRPIVYSGATRQTHDRARVRACCRTGRSVANLGGGIAVRSRAWRDVYSLSPSPSPSPCTWPTSERPGRRARACVNYSKPPPPP